MDCDRRLLPDWGGMFGVYRTESPHVGLRNGPFRTLRLRDRTADVAHLWHVDVPFHGLVCAETNHQRRADELGNAAFQLLSSVHFRHALRLSAVHFGHRAASIPLDMIAMNKSENLLYPLKRI